MRFLEIKQQKYRGFKPLVFLKRPENHSLNKSSIDADRLACDPLRFSADQKISVNLKWERRYETIRSIAPPRDQVRKGKTGDSACFS